MSRSHVLRFPAPEVRSFSVDPKTNEIMIRVYVGDSLAGDLSEALNWLSDLVGTARRTVSLCERQIKTDELIEQQRRRHIEVARAYQRLRVSGMKHRAAIRAIYIDPSFADLNAPTSDIAAWVKMYCLESKPRGSR
ncbi:MAG: hypothetical protein RI101_06215 [Nitrospira sp.]|jgi:hypothetical protein|nr:hypothetical protein [Nitrospira sp.]